MAVQAPPTDPDLPDVIVVNGTGLDHSRHAGMALHLGYLLNLPTVGVTHRPLCADGSWPDDEGGALVLSHTMVRSSAIESAPTMAHGHWWHTGPGEQVPKQPQRWSLLLRPVAGLPIPCGWPVKWPARPGQVLTRWSNLGDPHEISRSYTGPFTKYLS